MSLRLLSTLLITLVSEVLPAQVIQLETLKPIAIAVAQYNHTEEELELVLKCHSRAPITAWSFNVESTYSDNTRRPLGQLEDYAVQLSFPDDVDSSADNDSGVCFFGQQRRYHVPISRSTGDAILIVIRIQVDAVVDSDMNG